MTFSRCPVCRLHVETLLYDFRGAELAVIQRLGALNPQWNPSRGLCEHCLYLNEFDTLEKHFETPSHGTLFRHRVRNDFALLPTALRLNADPRFSGKGITIAFIDSGFYPHPDLTKPTNRIRAIVDVTDEQKGGKYFSLPHPESWHGTMTSVAAAGNGFLSKGLYRGIASKADVVLIKAMDARTKKINTENITRALTWAIDHRKEYNIQIISLSVGDDEPTPLVESPVNQAAEEAVANGMVVVAAVGNSPDRPIVPPASSPSVITIGGLDDKDQLRQELHSMYHSTFGKTVDGYLKPDLIAPAIWVAGPILPGSDQYKESIALFKLLKATPRTVATTLSMSELIDPPDGLAKGDYKEWARKRIQQMNYIAPYYKNIDGTSFAAPIVSSVIAQMLEATPKLTPREIKRILIETAHALPEIPKDNQGAGVLNPRGAIECALRERHSSNKPGVYINQTGLVFIYHNRVPRSVTLAGDFNSWDPAKQVFYESEEGAWSCWLPKPSPGEYKYKFVIDGTVWVEDPANSHKEPDNFGGWNSTFEIKD